MGNVMPSLWPADLVPTVERTPATILKEQAAQLGAATKNLLEGRVETELYGQGIHTVFVHKFSVVAPALEGYSYELLKLSHELELYPVKANYYGDPRGYGEEMELASEDHLIQYLRDVFARRDTRRVIGTLLAQVQS